jgi:DNA modification methylase
MKISDKLKTLPLKKLSEIKDLQGNLKDLSETNFNKLKQSIEEHGFKFPFYVWFDKKGVCWTLDGHQRKRVISSVYGDVEVPYIEVEAKDKKDAKKQILLISSQYGEVTKDGFDEFSFDIEKEFIDDFTTFDKWNDVELSEEILETEGDDDIPTEPKNIFVVRGDIFEIKANGVTLRVSCLDSTNSDDIEKLMNGSKADMVFTDPPYGMFLDTDYSQIKGTKNSIGFKENLKGNNYEKIIGDNSDFTTELINTIFSNFNYCKEIFIWGADYFVDLLPNFGKDGSWQVWNKRSSEAQQKAIGNTFELLWSLTKHKRFVYNFEWFGFLSKDDPSEARNRLHPSMKPSKLIEKIINDFCKGLNIVDLFCGSGTTALACLKTKRNCFTNDISENYVQVSVKRIIDFCEKNNFDYKITLNNESFDISKLNN